MVAGPGTNIRKIIAEGRIARNNPPRDPDLWLYRDRTRSMLRRYLRS
jgi:hypothetical protein